MLIYIHKVWGISQAAIIGLRLSIIQTTRGTFTLAVGIRTAAIRTVRTMFVR